MMEYMRSAVQYLQGKVLCHIPVSLASTMSSATVDTGNIGHGVVPHGPPPLNTNSGPAVPPPHLPCSTVASATPRSVLPSLKPEIIIETK
ncbi:unnamed protein product [Musa hybrid cultivar]